MATGDEAPKLTVADLQCAAEEIERLKRDPTLWEVAAASKFAPIDWLDELKGLYQDIAAVRDRTEVILSELDDDDKRRLQWALYELNEAAAAARAVVAYMERREK